MTWWWWLAGLLAGGVPLLALWCGANKRRGARGYPGEVEYPVVGALFTLEIPRFQKICIDNARASGFKTWALSVLGDTIIYSSSPKDAEFVLADNFDNFVKGEEFRDNFFEVLGNGIFSADGELWRAHRKAASHLFATGKLRAFQAEVFTKYARVLCDAMCDKARSGAEFDVQSLMFALTFDSFTELAFGESYDTLRETVQTGARPRFLRAFDEAMEITSKRFFAVPQVWKAMRWLRWGDEGILAAHVEIIDAHLEKLVDDVLAKVDKNIDERRDLITSYIIYARKQNKPELATKAYLKETAANFLLAGRDTTAQALSSFFRTIDLHRDARDRLEAEIDATLPADGVPTFDVLKKMPYLDACVREVIRLFPSVPSDGKFALTDCTTPTGIEVKKGDMLSYNICAINREPDSWIDGEAFRPERWLERTDPAFAVDAAKFQYHFVSFNGGPRKCLGEQLALVEMKTVVAMALHRGLRFELAHERDKDFLDWSVFKESPVMAYEAGLWGTCTMRK